MNIFLLELGARYVIEKAEIVRVKKSVSNAGAFMEAVSDDWKAPKALEAPKRVKPIHQLRSLSKNSATNCWQ